MAIVRSQDGHFFEVPDEVLKQHEIKSEDVPGGARESGPSLSQGSGMVGPNGGVSPVQIIVNYIQGGGGGQGGGMQGPPASDKPADAAQDVGGRYCNWRNCWHNCWRNCWRNYGHY